MGLREKLNDSSGFSIAIAVLVIVCLGYFIYGMLFGSPPSEGTTQKDVYYVPETGEFVYFHWKETRTNLPMMVEGKQAIMVRLWNCGTCDEDNNNNIVEYYEKYSDEAIAVINNPNSDADDKRRAIERGTLYSINLKDWYKEGNANLRNKKFEEFVEKCKTNGQKIIDCSMR